MTSLLIAGVGAFDWLFVSRHRMKQKPITLAIERLQRVPVGIWRKLWKLTLLWHILIRAVSLSSHVQKEFTASGRADERAVCSHERETDAVSAEPRQLTKRGSKAPTLGSACSPSSRTAMDVEAQREQFDGFGHEFTYNFSWAIHSRLRF